MRRCNNMADCLGDSKMDEIYVTRSSMPSYEEYIEAIKPLWSSHWLTNMGEYHSQLEKELTSFLRVPGISLMVNGHTALELLIQSFEFPKGSEIITTPFTFISTTHAIVRNGLEPVFCDVKEDDGTIDEDKIEDLITSKTVAILPVHVYGNICNHAKIQKIADKYNLKVIYDAAHAFGETVEGEGVGILGDASIFSFHATKVFHTIEGGAVVCKDADLYQRLYDLKDFGIRNEELVASIGANGKMNEFSAIMGLCNLKHIEESINDRKRVYLRYLSNLDNVRGIRVLIPKTDRDEKKNYSYFPIVVEKDYPITRDELFSRLSKDGIHARKYFYPLTADQACFKNRYSDVNIPVARELAERIMVLPIYEGLENKDIDRISNILKEV